MANMDDIARSCIHAAFERQAGRRPEATAVVLGDEKISYAELSERADRLAKYLRARGVNNGDIVAVLMSRSIEMIVTLLAILKSGAAYLPLDESNPVSRARLCLDDAGVTHIVTDRDCVELCGEDRISIRATAAKTGSAAMKLPAGEIGGDDKAYVMFTSGSTGRPKGVVVPHRAVLRLVLDTNYVEVSESDRVLQLSPTSFDASTFEIWAPLLNGGVLVLYSEATLDPNALKRDIDRHGVTMLWLTAALFHLIAHKYVEALRPVKVLLAGGDVLSPEAINRVLDRFPHMTVINGYGPTENTTFTCCHRMTTANRPTADGVAIGRAIAGTEIFVLDEQLRPVPVGQAGQLFAAGSGVALGYLRDDPERRFFRDESICEGLIYRTGDLVRRNAAGELEFIGRTDNQIKIRGFRVSLEEIKLQLLKLGGVIDAIVVPRKETSGDQLLVAYLKIQLGSELDAAAAKRQLAGTLPRYMIPDQFILSSELPITRNGKLDRNSLLADVSREHVS